MFFLYSPPLQMNTTNFNLINSTLNSTNSTESENSTLVRVPGM